MTNRRIEIHKFGGSSVRDAERLLSAARIVAEARTEAAVVVVCSALGGVTDTLVGAADAAVRGDRAATDQALERLATLHGATLRALQPAGNAAAEAELARILAEVADLLAATRLIREMTPRTRDRLLAVGEKLAVRLLAVALGETGLTAVPLDADTFLETDGRFGDAFPLAGVADRTVAAALRPHLAADRVPVVTGYCGRGPDGATTTLGRGGSDLTATALAAVLGAAEVTLWTDVPGVFSADPAIVPDARVLPHLNYREAAELSFYGAKVLHPRTMIPVVRRGIPVRTRSSYEPAEPGTVVDGRFSPGSHPVKALSAIPRQCLISVEGKGMAGAPGIAARVFGTLAAEGINVTMIGQSSAESSICLAVAAGDVERAEVALRHALRPDLSRGDIEELVVVRAVALVAVVGLGMAYTPGVSARVFGALGKHGVNVRAIAQGSSELNITLAIEERQTATALRAIHEAFGLHRVDTGVDAAREMHLLLIGCGHIGRALVELLLDRRQHVFQRFGLKPNVVAIADRSGYLLAPAGLSLETLRQVLDTKAAGHSLLTLGGPFVRAGSPADMVAEALTYRLSRPVVVDVSDADDTGLAFERALGLGADVVTANKKPLAGPLAHFERLQALGVEHGRLLKAEATVGAGLPVVDTLEMLLATGDRLRAAEGVLSGTLAFVMMRLEEGVAFSAAVAEAVQLGYTEPDPVADLSGADVARKALILGRLSGLVRSDAPVALEGLVDPALAGLPLADLLVRLEAYDGPMAARVAAARAAGAVLRYVARVAEAGIQVGPVAVPRESPQGALKGTDNLILFRSERYDARPLVITGPGAGVDVTAMGVLGDILRIAAERRGP